MLAHQRNIVMVKEIQKESVYNEYLTPELYFFFLFFFVQISIVATQSWKMRHEIVCRRFSKLNLKHLYICCKTKLAILVITWVSLHLFCSLLNKKQIRKTAAEKNILRIIRSIQKPTTHQQTEMRTPSMNKEVFQSCRGYKKCSELTFSNLLQQDSSPPYDLEADRLPLHHTKLHLSATMFMQLALSRVACSNLALPPLPVFFFPAVLTLQECSACRDLKSCFLVQLPPVKIAT